MPLIFSTGISLSGPYMSAPVAHLFHHAPTDLSAIPRSESNHWLQQCGMAGFDVHQELRSVNDSMISTTDHLLIGLRASQPVTSAASPGSGCSVPFDRLWSPFPGPHGSVPFWDFLAVPGPAQLKQVTSFADAAQLLRGCGRRASQVHCGHRTEPRIWCGRPAWRMEARRGGSCFQRLSPSPVALSCAFTASLGVLSQISISLFSLFSSI